MTCLEISQTTLNKKRHSNSVKICQALPYQKEKISENGD